MKIKWKILISSLIIVYGIAFLGSLFTSSAVNSQWYDSIKPSLTPPDYVFPIVWNILFFMIALSLYFAWTAAKNKSAKKNISFVFGLNLLLNVLWSFLFFKLQNPMLAFFELIILWISIIAMIFTTWKINRKSAWLLVPYLVWVFFAGVLNWVIVFG